MLSALSDAGAEFLIVGAHALAFHGYPRATGDLDLWIRANPENADRVWQAIERFGAPRRNLEPKDLCEPDIVFQIGIEPNRIDILTSISGVDFADAWKDRKMAIINGRSQAVIGRDHLLKNKLATARPKDLLDASWLQMHPD
jgi:hypothetical protein